jgi:hypothetical protein
VSLFGLHVICHVKTVYNRLRSKYSAQERATGVWLKPEIERFAGKSEEILRPNASTQHMMARSLAGTPQLSDVNLHGLSSRKKSRAGKHGIMSLPLYCIIVHSYTACLQDVQVSRHLFLCLDLFL